MVFGYDAKPIFANSTAGIVEHARDLLRCLVEMREGRDVSVLEIDGLIERQWYCSRDAWLISQKEIKRPLIFIGHSLGGLVIKQVNKDQPIPLPFSFYSLRRHS